VLAHFETQQGSARHSAREPNCLRGRESSTNKAELAENDSRDARCYSDEATKEMITRYAVVVWDCISIISFLGRACAPRGSFMTDHAKIVNDT